MTTLNSQIKSLDREIESLNSDLNHELNILSQNIGSNININGSIISAGGDLNLIAADNLSIANEVDSNFIHVESEKKSTTRVTKSVSVNYKESAKKSELSGNNINLSAGGDVLIQASDLTTDNDLTIGRNVVAKNNDGSYVTDGNGNFVTQNSEVVDNVVIRDAILDEYSFSHTSREYHGVAKVYANAASQTIGIVDLYVNLFNNLTFGVFEDNDFLSKYTPGGQIVKQSDALTKTSLYNIKEKTFKTTNKTNSVSSNLNVGDSLDVKADGGVVIIGSEVRSGLSDVTVDKTDNNVEGKISIESKTLDILASQETEVTTTSHKKKRTLQFNNFDTTLVKSDVVDTVLVAKGDNFDFNVEDKINVSYNGRERDVQVRDQNLSQTLSYVGYLEGNYEDQLTQSVLYDTVFYEEDAVRGLTETGTALVAVAAVVAVVVTGGAAAAGSGLAVSAGAAAGGTVAAGAGVVATAVASTAATTAAVSGTNASMNAEGDLFKQLKTTSKTTWDDVTSREALDSYLIAAGTALVTMGITSGVDYLTNSGNVANGVNATGVGSGASAKVSVANSSNITSLNINSEWNSLANLSSNVNQPSILVNYSGRLLGALKGSAVQTLSTSVVESAVRGDSFGDALERSGKQLLVNSVAQIVANDIGGLAHSGEISKPTQLALHGFAGCGLAVAGGNDCGAGAVSGVVSEYLGEGLYYSTYMDRSQVIEVSKLIGGLASAAVVGPDDGGSVFAGSQIGRNAVENNAIYIGGTVKLPFSDLITGKGNDWDLHSGIAIGKGLEEVRYGTDGKSSSYYVIPEFSGGGYINVVPHNEKVDISYSLGYKNLGSIDYLKTKNGNKGYGITIGLSSSILTIVPGNINISKD